MGFTYKYSKTYRTSGTSETRLLHEKVNDKSVYQAAQLHELESLHAISDALLDEGLQKTLGFECISASQLSRKTNNLNPAILSAMFLDLVTKIKGYHHQRRSVIPLKIIDSSTLPLNF